MKTSKPQTPTPAERLIEEDRRAWHEHRHIRPYPQRTYRGQPRHNVIVEVHGPTPEDEENEDA